MKKFIALAFLFALCVSLSACGGSQINESSQAPKTESSQSADVSTPESSTSTKDESKQPDDKQVSNVDIEQLKQGDEVSIIGQVASSKLVNENTVWVQVLRPEERTLIYHCQLKDDFIEQGSKLKMLDIAKIKGNFLSLMDMEQENTAILITLYDCEIVE